MNYSVFIYFRVLLMELSRRTVTVNFLISISNISHNLRHTQDFTVFSLINLLICLLSLVRLRFCDFTDRLRVVSACYFSISPDPMVGFQTSSRMIRIPAKVVSARWFSSGYEWR